MSKIILGGGVSGLSAGYYLRKKFPLEPISLIEASARTGGWIKSVKQEEGYIFEQGPRTIRPRGVKGLNTLELVEDLGLSNKVQSIRSNHPAALNRMIYVKGELHSLPSSFLGIFKTQLPFSKPLITYLLNDLKAPQKVTAKNDESIYNFVKRRFGAEIADYAISPLICGICAGNAQDISVKFLMEDLFNYEQKYGNITKGIVFNMFNRNKTENRIDHGVLSKKASEERWSVYSFKDGLETLPKRLEEVNKQNQVKFYLNTKCTKIILKDEAIVYTDGSDPLTTKHLISCLPSKTLGDLLVGHDPLKELLKSIPFVDVCVVNIQYKTKVLSKEGFGFLIPPKEKLPILGVIFDTCCFPHDQNTVLTVMMGGHWFKEYFGNSPTQDYLMNVVLDHLRKILNIKENPASYQIHILRDCIPQYIVGHKAKIDQIDGYIKANNLPLSLCGSSYHGVGINDVIFSAKTAVSEIHG